MFRKLFVFKYIALFYALLIFIVSAIPQIPPPLGFKWGDKVAHLLEYGIFSFLLFLAFYTSGKEFLKRHVFFLSVLIGMVYGLTDEIHQKFVPGRDCNIYDFLADCLGIIAVQVVLWMYLRKRKKRQKGSVEIVRNNVG
ncbi:MAG TPA: VanZ family protein [candidate division Zixibacteria bacterium]